MDIQALSVAFAGVVTAVGAVITGIYTGKSGRVKDENQARVNLENFRLQREAAEEIATRGRIEAIAADATEARRRLREAEDEFDKQIRETRNEFDKQIRDLRSYAQRGWDLAQYHFGLLATIAHLLNNILIIETLEGTPERLVAVVQNARRRMESLGPLPVSLEDPLNTILKGRDMERKP